MKRNPLAPARPGHHVRLDPTGECPLGSDDGVQTRSGGDRANRLMIKSDRSLLQFSGLAGEASRTASEYHTACGEAPATVERTAAHRLAAESAAWVRWTRAMMECARDVAEEMRRRDMQAAALRDDLDDARRDAVLDQLTELADRCAFARVFEQECHAARNLGGQLCVAFCGIDGFRLVNDLHGHHAGDRMNQAVARALQRIGGENCHLARHGGKEFVLLFRSLALPHVGARLDEARAEFARRRLINRDTDIPIGTVTISGGVADVLAYADPRAALKAANDALRAAEDQGGNHILVAGRRADPAQVRCPVVNRPG